MTAWHEMGKIGWAIEEAERVGSRPVGIQQKRPLWGPVYYNKSCFRSPNEKHLRWWSSWLWHPAVMEFQSVLGCRRFDSAPTDFIFLFISS